MHGNGKSIDMSFPTRIGTKPTDYVEEMKLALENKLYKAALSLAFMIPDICAALESGCGRTNRDRYIKWCDDYLLSNIDDGFPLEFSSGDLYQVRNSLLHNGSVALDKGKLTQYNNIRFSVFESPSPLVISCGNWSSSDGLENEHLTINLVGFVGGIAAAVDRFLEARPDCNRENEKSCPFYSGMVDFTHK